ncbi:MAG: signal recognition particle-docking protein FtsY [Chitinophagales bacterium]
MSFFKKLFSKKNKKEDLDKGLEKSSQGIFSKLSKAVAGRTEIDVDLLDSIEEALVASDIGVDTTIKIIDRLEARAERDKYLNVKEVYQMLKDEIIDLLSENNTPDYTDFTLPDTCGQPYIMMIVGVNGTGKTTTVGKLAYQFEKQGKKVVMGAADTFRAAAIDQLEVWAERSGTEMVKQKMGSDPAAVAYDTVSAAVSRSYDVCLVDTAGRLHNKKHLMDELSKIKRVMKKVDSDFPHDVMLVLDGSTGQNALEQAKQFTNATEVTCIAITKLDGTAKGGVVIGIADQFKIPIKYIGVGEGIDHLQVFNKKEFVDSLFNA